MTKPTATQDNAGLVERLRKHGTREASGYWNLSICDEAADEIERLTHPVETAANADDGLAGELDGLLYSIIRMPMSNKGGELVRWRKKASERAQSILTALRARAAQADDGAER